MIKKVITVVTLVALFTVAIVQAIEKEQMDRLPGLKIGTEAPDFTLKSLDGSQISLSDYKGQKLMLNFWATWCGPCKQEMPEMQAYYEEHKNDDFTVLAVNIDPYNDVQSFAEELGITFPIVMDEKEKGKELINEIYKTISIPTTYVIDENGIIQGKYIGVMDKETINELMIVES